MKNKEPQVILFGRTNVGKSTIFNTLSEKRIALVSDEAGTTRDSNYSHIEWRDLNFRLIDTAGIIENRLLKKQNQDKDYDIERQVQEQARSMLDKADLVLFVVDTRDGILPDDKELVRQLRKLSNVPVILVANKADNPRLRKDAYEFNSLGIGEPLAISATTGSGTGDLLDEIHDTLKEYVGNKKVAHSSTKADIKITILGKPNVGKSSLINKLAGEDIQIISHVAHTTREPRDIIINHQEKNIKLIDTAGMHKKGLRSVKSKQDREKLERLSIEKSLKTLRDADIAILMVDISSELTQQEAKICEAIIKNKCSLIIIANKWDKVKERDTKHYTLEINRRFPYATWAPIQFISAKTGEKIKHLKNLIIEVDEQRRIDLNENTMNKFLKQIIRHHRPVKSKGTKKPYIHSFKQTQAAPPKFTLKIGAKDSIHDSYVRFIENQLRKKFGFLGTPITIYVEKAKAVHGQHEQYLKKQQEEND